MAEIIQPSGNILGGGAPTVGAVVFDKPQYDPVTLQMKVMGDLDEWQKERDIEAAKKRADIDKFALSLTVNPDGIHPNDTEGLKQRMDALQDKVANVYRYQQGTPQFIAAKADAQKAQEEAKLFVAASKAQNESLQALTKQFDPTKYDDEHFKEWFRKASEANNPYDRQKLMNETGLVPKRSNLEDLTLEKLEAANKAGLLKPTETKYSYGKTPSGEDISVTQTETLTEPQRLKLASDWISNDPKIKNAVMEKFSELSPTDIDFYTKKTADLNQKYGASYYPYDVFYANNLEKYANKETKRAQMGYSPERTQAAQYEYGEGKKLKTQGAGLLEAVSGAFQGKPEYLQPIKTYSGYDAVGIRGLNNYTLGTTQVMTKDGPKSVNNNILETIRTPDGKLMVMSTKTLYDEKVRQGYIDPKTGLEYTPDELSGKKLQPLQTSRLYITYDNATQLFNDIATGTFGKDGGEQIKIGAIEYAKPLGGYNDATAFKSEAIVPMSEEDKAKRDAIYGKSVQLKPIEKGTTPFKVVENVKEVIEQKPQPKTNKGYTINGKQYKTIEEIKALSPAYTDEVIQKAINDGRIKVE